MNPRLPEFLSICCTYIHWSHVLVRFTTVCQKKDFRSKFMGISKPIHFWNAWSMENLKINVYICTDASVLVNSVLTMAAHKMQIFNVSMFLTENCDKH